MTMALHNSRVVWEILVRRRVVLLSVLIVSTLSPFAREAAMADEKGSAGMSQTPNTPLVLSSGPHLFIDDYLVAQSSNLSYTLHHPTRPAAPIVGGVSTPDKCVQPYFTVIYDGVMKKYRIWYGTASQHRSDMGYLESTDGENWIRPARVVMAMNGYGPSVIDEGPGYPEPATRFKSAYWEQLDSVRYTESQAIGMCVAFSSDGINWTKYAANPVLPDLWQYSPEVDPQHIGDPRWKQTAGDIVDVTWDPLRRRYLACVKSYTQPPTEFGPVSRSYEYGRRLVSQSTSEDFMHWTTPRRIIVPDDQDEGDIEFYGMAPKPRGDLLIGFLRVLHDDVEDGIGYTVLATSRDGETWVRQRQPFIDRNPEPGAWDHGMAWVSECITVGDEEFLYYGGYARGHKFFSDRSIGLAKLRKNGFVSRDAGSKLGRLRTPLVVTDATEMTVNANVDGELRVRLLDRAGQPCPGFDWQDCTPIRGDATAQPVIWNGSPAELPGEPVQLEFGFRRAQLYSFELHK